MNQFRCEFFGLLVQVLKRKLTEKKRLRISFSSISFHSFSRQPNRTNEKATNERIKCREWTWGTASVSSISSIVGAQISVCLCVCERVWDEFKWAGMMGNCLYRWSTEELMQFFFKKSKQNLKFVVVLKRHSVKANE